MHDVELLEQIREGNMGAYRFLIEQNQNLVWGLIFRLVNQKEDAEDLYQEVFLRVYRDIKKFRGDSKLSTWIGSITYNTCTDFLRKRGRLNYESHEDISVAYKISSDLPDPQERVNKRYIREKIKEIVDKLPVKYRAVISLYHFDEFSYKEIAEITSMPEGTVKSYINRGRTMIKENIEKMHPEIALDYNVG